MAKITILTSKRICNKEYEFNNGKVSKTTYPEGKKAPSFYEGSGETVDIDHISDLVPVLQEMSKWNDECLSLGYWEDMPDDEPFRISSKKNYEADKQIPELLEQYNHFTKRLKHIMTSGGIILFDKDDPEDLEWNDWVEQMDKIIPGFKSVDKVVTQSNSSRVGLGKNKWHCYVMVKDIEDLTDLRARFKTTSLHLCLGGYIKNKAGHKKFETITDLSVLSPERVIYEGRPTVKGNQDVIKPADIRFIQGDNEILDTSAVKNIKVKDDGIVVTTDHKSYVDFKSEDYVYNEKDGGEALTLLEYIPDYLGYTQRLPVNQALLNIFGNEKKGISLLFNHWTTDDRNKLLSDLKYMAENQWKPLGIKTLRRLAKYYSPKKFLYKKPIKKTDLDVNPFEKPLTIAEASQILKDAISDYIQYKENIFINLSAGFGKTRAIIEAIAGLCKLIEKKHDWMRQKSVDRKIILILVKDHQLMEQIHNDIKDMLKIKHWMIGVQMIKGKNQFCEDCSLYKLHNPNNKPSTPILPKICRGIHNDKIECMAQDEGCKYIDQWESLANIFIMTHQEYYTEYNRYNKLKHIDYLIIDENVIEDDYVYTSNKPLWQSIRNVVNELENGKTLAEITKGISIIKQVEKDYKSMKNLKKPTLPEVIDVNSDEYKSYVQNYQKVNANKRDNVLLDALYKLIVKGHPLIEKFDWNSEFKTLYYHYLKTPSQRYENVPTIFLDATGNEEIAQIALAKTRPLKYLNIEVEQSKNITSYQIYDYNLTKTKMDDDDNQRSIVEMLKNIINRKGYKNVGLISPLNVGGDNISLITDYDEYLANKLGIKEYGHFGNIRGSNDFEECDCLFVLGRQCIPPSALVDKCKAIFCKTPSTDYYEEKVPIKLSNNNYVFVYNRVYDDPELQQCHLMYNTAETVQTVARLRLIHDSGKKDLYIFSNESLYEHITITDLISIKDLLIDHQYDEGIQKILNIGYCRDMRETLMSEKFSDFSDTQQRNISKNKDLLLASGLLEHKKIQVNSNSRKYFVSVSNPEPFEQHYEELKKIRRKTKK